MHFLLLRSHTTVETIARRLSAISSSFSDFNLFCISFTFSQALHRQLSLSHMLGFLTQKGFSLLKVDFEMTTSG